MIFSILGSNIGAVNYGIVDERFAGVDMLTSRNVEMRICKIAEM